MKNIKSLAKKNIKLKISVETLNEQFELPDGSYSVSYIQEYFEYIIKKHKTVNDNLSIKIYLNKTENRIAFKIKTRYYLELLLTERTIFLVGSSKSKITKDKNDKNMPQFEITEVLLIYCNIVNNDYQQDSRALYTFVSNKSVSRLLDISPKNWKNFSFSKTFYSRFSNIEVCLI